MRLVAVHRRDQHDVGRLPGSPEAPGADRAAARPTCRSCATSTTAGPVAGDRPRPRAAGAGWASEADGEPGRAATQRPSGGARSSHRGGEVGVGEDAGRRRACRRGPGARGPGPSLQLSLGGLGRVPAAAGSQRTRISRPAIAVTHHSAMATMPTSGTAEQRVLRRDQERPARATSASDPGDGVDVEQPAADRRTGRAASSPRRRSRVSTTTTAARAVRIVDDRLGTTRRGSLP